MLQHAIAMKPGHQLSALYLFQDQSLLAELKKLVTLEGGITGLKASGVPPHVKILKQNADMKVEMAKMVSSLESQSAVIVKAVEHSILQNNVKSGIVSLNTLEVSLNYVLLLKNPLTSHPLFTAQTQEPHLSNVQAFKGRN